MMDHATSPLDVLLPTNPLVDLGVHWRLRRSRSHAPAWERVYGRSGVRIPYRSRGSRIKPQTQQDAGASRFTFPRRSVGTRIKSSRLPLITASRSPTACPCPGVKAPHSPFLFLQSIPGRAIALRKLHNESGPAACPCAHRPHLQPRGADQKTAAGQWQAMHQHGRHGMFFAELAITAFCSVDGTEPCSQRTG